MAFRAAFQLPLGLKVRTTLPLASGPVDVTGNVMHIEKGMTAGTQVYTHGVQFVDMPIEIRDAIELHCMHYSVPMWRMKYRQSQNLLSKAAEFVANVRGERRYLVQLPARVMIESQDGKPPVEGLALLEDVSPGGARLLMEIPVAPQTAVTFEVPGTSFSGTGRVMFNRALESPMKVRFVVGLSRQARQSRFKAWTKEWRSLALRPVDENAAR
jgi:hypothetical protein